MRSSLLGLGAGTVAGVVALGYISGPLLPKVFGGLILLAVLISIASPKVVATPGTLLVGSTAAGIMGAMVGIHGPAIALVLQNSKPMQARATLGAFFAVGYVIAVALRAVAGLFGAQELMLGLLLLPGVAIGYLAAPAISQFIDQATLRVAILVISSASACLAPDPMNARNAGSRSCDRCADARGGCRRAARRRGPAGSAG